MTTQLIRPVILCGGSGNRLWPVSRKSMPKQFSRLTNDKTMLQNTVERLEDCGCSAPILMTGNDYRFVVGEQLAEIGSVGHKIVIEPEGRNTAPAICAAAEILHAEDPDTLMLVAPADHDISDVMKLGDAIAVAAEKARAGELVTFGIRPSSPETGYGYIELEAETAASTDAQQFLRFVEKPNAETAAEMVGSGNYLWNSGIFMFSVATIRQAFASLAPELVETVKSSVGAAQPDLDFVRLGNEFSTAEDISVDYAIMEKVPGWVVPIDAGWTDLGSWRGVWQNSERNAEGVAYRGNARSLDCTDTLLYSNDDAVEVFGIGLRNIAAVATKDAVLITDLDSGQSVSQAVATLKKEKVKQAVEFPRNSRPWGHYESLATGPRFQVKSIVVKPGGKLSLQSHVHRAEHWVVVEGTATVTIGTTEKLVSENQSVYIPLGEIHRLENTGKVPLQLIEVQTGAYLGEDDIVRYEDIYERA